MKSNNQFSNDKIFFHPERLKPALRGDLAAPIVYELSLSGLCNCRCAYCCCKDYHENQMLSRSDIDLLVHKLAGSAKAVTITGGGEPLTNPHFSYCVRELKRSGLSVGVITNGLLLNRDSIEAAAANASFLRVSLDTVDPARHKAIRGVTFDAEKLMADLTDLSRRKRELNAEILIGTQIVYIDQPREDIENTIRFAKAAGVDFIQIRPVDNIPDTELTRNYDFYIQNREALSALAETYTDGDFRVILNHNKFEEYYNGKVSKDYPKCLGANFTASIGHDMQLYFCCTHIGNPRYALGSLRDSTLEELLFSQKRKQWIDSPCFGHCQIQCRNHKLNTIMRQLTDLPQEQLVHLLEEKSAAPTPLHYEFL